MSVNETTGRTLQARNSHHTLFLYVTNCCCHLLINIISIIYTCLWIYLCCLCYIHNRVVCLYMLKSRFIFKSLKEWVNPLTMFCKECNFVGKVWSCFRHEGFKWTVKWQSQLHHSYTKTTKMLQEIKLKKLFKYQKNIGETDFWLHRRSTLSLPICKKFNFARLFLNHQHYSDFVDRWLATPHGSV